MTTLLALALIIQPSAEGLRPVVDRRKLDFGTCVVSDLIKDNADGGKYVQALKDHVNLIEPENDLKPAAMWKGVNEIDFSKPDFLLGAPGKKGWAQGNKIKVRGHVLCYPNEPGYTTPGWLLAKEKELTADQTRELLKNYILTVAGRYKGKISSWDVINEIISDGPNGNQFNVRSSIWFRKLGMDFIPLCFKWAKQADPKAKLYYNDYGCEAGGRKLDDAIAMCNWIRSQGGPVDGIGLQYHIGSWAKVAPGSAFHQTVEKIEKNGYDWMITELDYAVETVTYRPSDPNYGLVPKNPKDLETQGATIGAIVEMALKSKRCKGINLWGITDRHSWIPGFSRNKNGAATMLDADYNAKPAVEYILKALRSK
jgi:endo-1,4-beta-xylanase